MIFIVFNIYSVNESDLQRDEVAIIKVFVKYIYISFELNQNTRSLIEKGFEKGNTALGVGEAKAREESIFVLSSFVCGPDHLESNFLVLDWEASLPFRFRFDEQNGARFHKLSPHRIG